MRPVLIAMHHAAELAFANLQNTRIGKSAIVALFSSPIRAGSHWAHVKDVKESAGAVFNVMPETIQHDPFCAGSVMVWGGLGSISLEGRTDLQVTANSTLTAVRYWDEILRAMGRPYADAIGPGFLPV